MSFVTPGAVTTSRPDAASGTASGLGAFLLRRWPTGLAIAFMALVTVVLAGRPIDLAEPLLLLPLIYLATAVLRRRQLVWVVFPAAFATLFALGLQDWVAPWVGLVVVALFLLIWGGFRGQFRSGVFVAQVLGMVGFGALAVAAIYVDHELGRYLVAAGWFTHGIWDFVHHRADKVVARSFAEFCAVVDVLVAAAILFLL